MDDSPWASDASFVPQSEWSKITSQFLNSGYREGITAGKESALQSAFDAGFSQIGVPLGRRIGLLRGTVLALLSSLDNNHSIVTEIKDIQSQLSDIRLSDLAPRDVEAEEHAKVHLAAEDAEVIEDEQLIERRNMEQLEDMMSSISADGSRSRPGRLGPDNLRLLEERVEVLTRLLDVV